MLLLVKPPLHSVCIIFLQYFTVGGYLYISGLAISTHYAKPEPRVSMPWIGHDIYGEPTLHLQVMLCQVPCTMVLGRNISTWLYARYNTGDRREAILHHPTCLTCTPSVNADKARLGISAFWLFVFIAMSNLQTSWYGLSSHAHLTTSMVLSGGQVGSSK